MDTKITKVIALNILLIGLALYLSGCGNQVYTPEVSPFSPTITITPSSPGATVIVPATEPTLPPYPTSSENFVKTPSISGPDAEKRITELGAGGDLSALKDWYRANGIPDSQILPILYEGSGEIHWNLAAKSANGNFLKFTITSGAESDQVVRAMGMVAYLYNKPSFRTSELKTPSELLGSTQEMMWDESGWNVVGTFRDGAMTGWYNADKNMWLIGNASVPGVSITDGSSLYQLNGTELSIYNNITKSFELAKDKQGNSLEITAVKNINEEFLLIASNNSVFEWTKEGGLAKREIEGVWPKEIKIAGFNIVESLDKSGKPLGQMYQAVDEKGRTMLVKPAGKDKNWVVAPFGAALSNGVWRVWNVLNDGRWQEMSVVDAQGEMSKSSRLEPIAKIVIEELTNPEVEGAMYSFSEYTDFDLEVVPGREHEVYLRVLDAYAKSPVNRAYWNDVGFHGNTGEELYDWLKGSVGGPENQPYWLPGKSPNGIEFSSIVANGAWFARVGSWTPMVNNGGVYLKDIPYVFVSPFAYRNNVWANSFVTQLIRQNVGNPRPFVNVQLDSRPVSAWGMFLLDNHAIFMESSTSYSPVFPLLYLGDKEGGGQEIDPKAATAWLIEYTSHLAQYQDKNITQNFCVSRTLECEPRYVEVETLTDTWFRFK